MSPMPAPAATTGVAAGAVLANAVSSPATTSTPARPSGISSVSLYFAPAAFSINTPQPVPSAATTTGNTTQARINIGAGPAKASEAARPADVTSATRHGVAIASYCYWWLLIVDLVPYSMACVLDMWGD